MRKKQYTALRPQSLFAPSQNEDPMQAVSDGIEASIGWSL